jgi:hypothetical protein
VWDERCTVGKTNEMGAAAIQSDRRDVCNVTWNARKHAASMSLLEAQSHLFFRPPWRQLQRVSGVERKWISRDGASAGQLRARGTPSSLTGSSCRWIASPLKRLPRRHSGLGPRSRSLRLSRCSTTSPISTVEGSRGGSRQGHGFGARRGPLKPTQRQAPENCSASTASGPDSRLRPR